MPDTADDIRQFIEDYRSQLIADRRHFHQHPELGFEEIETAKFIAKRLESLGFSVKTQVGKTGVVGVWPGVGPGPCIAFRADMDALELDETSEVDYRSKNPGVMHGCGHDGHMAMLLGLAKWISTRKTPFPGPIKLIFQPGEEGLGGARHMIEDGALLDPKVDMIFGLHLWNSIPVGKLGIGSGPIMAGNNGFAITVKGSGGHTAQPQEAVDAMVIAAHIVVALQTLVSRNVDPLDSIVLSISKIESRGALNVIPEKVTIRGMSRHFLPKWKDELPALVKRIAQGVAQGMGGDIELDWTHMYPPTVNDEKAAALAEKAAKSFISEENAVDSYRTMASEDMSYFLERVPGCYFFVGSANDENGLNKPHHNPQFDIDERALEIGLGIFASITESFFKE